MAHAGPEFEAAFLRQLQQLLTDGSYVSTYKYALLLALVRWALEHPEHDEAVPVDAREIAPHVIAIYWHHVEPFSSAEAMGGSAVAASGPGAWQLPRTRMLQQERGKQPLAVLAAVAAARLRLRRARELPAQRAYDADEELVRDVTRSLVAMPLWKLQNVAGTGGHDGFLYRRVHGRARLFAWQPGVVRCLVTFAALIEDHVRAAWIRFVLKCNQQLLGQATSLESFLFPGARASLERWREPLRAVGRGSCFYCRQAMRPGTEVVDHFLPWARYPRDLGHNFVLAHARCNGAKQDHLAAADHLARWCARNQECAAELQAALDEQELPHDAGVTRSVAGALYGTAAELGQRVWVAGRELVPLSPAPRASWRAALAAWRPAG